MDFPGYRDHKKMYYFESQSALLPSGVVSMWSVLLFAQGHRAAIKE